MTYDTVLGHFRVHVRPRASDSEDLHSPLLDENHWLGFSKGSIKMAVNPRRRPFDPYLLGSMCG